MALQRKQDRILEGWLYSPVYCTFIGLRVRRFFKGYGASDGIIDSYLPPEINDGAAFYHLLHDDHDDEDIGYEDMLEYRNNYLQDKQYTRKVKRVDIVNNISKGKSISKLIGISTANATSKLSASGRSRPHRLSSGKIMRLTYDGEDTRKSKKPKNDFDGSTSRQDTSDENKRFRSIRLATINRKSREGSIYDSDKDTFSGEESDSSEEFDSNMLAAIPDLISTSILDNDVSDNKVEASNGYNETSQQYWIPSQILVNEDSSYSNLGVVTFSVDEIEDILHRVRISNLISGQIVSVQSSVLVANVIDPAFLKSIDHLTTDVIQNTETSVQASFPVSHVNLTQNSTNTGVDYNEMSGSSPLSDAGINPNQSPNIELSIPLSPSTNGQPSVTPPKSTSSVSMNLWVKVCYIQKLPTDIESSSPDILVYNPVNHTISKVSSSCCLLRENRDEIMRLLLETIDETATSDLSSSNDKNGYDTKKIEVISIFTGKVRQYVISEAKKDWSVGEVAELLKCRVLYGEEVLQSYYQSTLYRNYAENKSASSTSSAVEKGRSLKEFVDFFNTYLLLFGFHHLYAQQKLVFANTASGKDTKLSSSTAVNSYRYYHQLLRLFCGCEVIRRLMRSLTSEEVGAGISMTCNNSTDNPGLSEKSSQFSDLKSDSGNTVYNSLCNSSSCEVSSHSIVSDIEEKKSLSFNASSSNTSTLVDMTDQLSLESNVECVDVEKVDTLVTDTIAFDYLGQSADQAEFSVNGNVGGDVAVTVSDSQQPSHANTIAAAVVSDFISDFLTNIADGVESETGPVSCSVNNNTVHVDSLTSDLIHITGDLLSAPSSVTQSSQMLDRDQIPSLDSVIDVPLDTVPVDQLSGKPDVVKIESTDCVDIANDAQAEIVCSSTNNDVTKISASTNDLVIDPPNMLVEVLDSIQEVTSTFYTKMIANVEPLVSITSVSSYDDSLTSVSIHKQINRSIGKHIDDLFDYGFRFDKQVSGSLASKSTVSSKLSKDSVKDMSMRPALTITSPARLKKPESTHLLTIEGKATPVNFLTVDNKQSEDSDITSKLGMPIEQYDFLTKRVLRRYESILVASVAMKCQPADIILALNSHKVRSVKYLKPNSKSEILEFPQNNSKKKNLDLDSTVSQTPVTVVSSRLLLVKPVFGFGWRRCRLSDLSNGK